MAQSQSKDAYFATKLHCFAFICVFVLGKVCLFSVFLCVCVCLNAISVFFFNPEITPNCHISHRAVLRGRDFFFPVKDRTLRTPPQLGVSGMKSARIRNDHQKNFPRLRLGLPFFLPKIWGRGVFFSIKDRPGFKGLQRDKDLYF